MSALVTTPKRRRTPVGDLPPKSVLPGPIARVAGIGALIVATLYFVAPVVWVMFAPQFQ